jgi:type I restriction enzyme S subunit
MSEWQETSIAESAIVMTGFAFKGNEYEDRGSLKVVRGENVTVGKLRWDSEKHWNKSTAGLEKFFLREEDIVVGMDGSRVGNNRARIKSLELPLILAQRVACIRAKERFDQGFLWYNIFSDLFKDYVEAVHTGTSIPHISQKQILDFEFRAPVDKIEQTAIAAILSSLDDKIDLLHRQNDTLEKMAEALFRQWFVVEAKEEWETRPLSSIANFLNGLACQKFPPKNDIDKLPVLKIKELSGGISENSDYATTDINAQYFVEKGDVIFAWSASLMVKLWTGKKCIINQHLFKVTSDEFPKWFYYLWCKHHLAEFISIASSHATTMGHIKRGDLDGADVLIPGKSELEKMDKAITPMIDKMIKNYEQINILTELRDTLLPKLMSGEVRVQS